MAKSRRPSQAGQFLEISRASTANIFTPPWNRPEAFTS